MIYYSAAHLREVINELGKLGVSVNGCDEGSSSSQRIPRSTEAPRVGSLYIILYNTLLYCIILYYSILCYIILHHIMFYYIMLYHIVL